MRTKKYKSRYLWLAAAVFWMALIFHFSAQKAAESSEISGSLTYRMTEGVNELFRLDWNGETLIKYAKVWEHPVRKAAHMTEYAVLASIFLGNCVQYPALRKRRFFWAWLFASIYAATDEFHQLFVEGRSGEFLDVAVDSAGAALGVLLLWAVFVLYRKKRKKKEVK